MVLAYSAQLTPRLKYIFQFIFTDILRLNLALTNSEEEYNSYSGVKFAYGSTSIGNTPFFQASHLLFDSGITGQKTDLSDWRDHKIFFQVKNGSLPFDPFAASFYLVTRYEEYLPNTKDRHKRFKPESSLAWKAQFIERPIINIWAQEIKKILTQSYPDAHFPEPVFTFTPTIDVDNAYAYKNKGILKNGVKLLLSLLTLRFKDFTDRFKVISRIQNDPYDSFEKQIMIHEKYNLKAIYFFLLGNGSSRYDRNLSHTNNKYQELIKRIKSKADVGMHPSYASNFSFGDLKNEKTSLSSILGTEVTKSRQHYIKLDFPHTYRNLLEIGIKEDYSMGYPSYTGYRASTSTPFWYYDLEKDEKTSLKIYPFLFMDTTLKVYMKKRSKDVLPYLKPIIQELKTVGGNLIFIFHNESIGAQKKWKNWTNTYEDIIRLLIKE